MNIAYIEDDKSVNETTCMILSKYKINILPFLTFERFNITRPEGLDLILTDGDLEHGKNCYHVLQLREQIYKNVPLILYSGNHEYVEHFKRNGFEAFLKGSDSVKLIERIKIYSNR